VADAAQALRELAAWARERAHERFAERREAMGDVLVNVALEAERRAAAIEKAEAT
jgi:hypothetical protein